MVLVMEPMNTCFTHYYAMQLFNRDGGGWIRPYNTDTQANNK